MSLINRKNNTCPICLTDNLSWNLNYSKTQMEMFKCGHGTCKQCFQKMQQMNRTCEKSFSCPLCREHEQQHTTGFLTKNVGKWTTFAEWYNEFEIYIKSGLANNIIRNSVFGKQLLRLNGLHARKNKSKSKTPKGPTLLNSNISISA